jgi:tetratricopeptide (TPR) repeat protein
MRVISLACVLTVQTGLAVRGDEPAPKPPWQRLLQGDDAKNAAEQEKKLEQLQEAGQFAEALKVAESLAELRAKAQGADHWEAVNARFEVEAIRRVLKAKKEEQKNYSRTFSSEREAQALGARGQYREAHPLYEQILSIYRKVLGEDHFGTAIGYNNLAVSLNAQGKHQEAEEGYRKSLAIRRKLLGEEHPGTAKGYSNLGSNLNHQGKYKDAEDGLRESLVIKRKVLGEDDFQMAVSYNNLGYSLNNQGKYREAEGVYRKSLDIRRKLLGEEHPETARGYSNLAYNLYDQGKYQEAREDSYKALAIRRKLLGEEHPDTALSYGWVATILYTQGKYREAEQGFHKALAITRKVLGDEHPATARNYQYVAANQHAQGHYREAETFCLRAANSFTKARLRIAASGLERATITSERSPLPSLAAVLARNGKPDDAWQRFEESLARGTWDDLTARLHRPQAERDKQMQIAGRIDRLNSLIQRANVAKPTPEQTKQREELLTQLRQMYDELAAFAQQLEKKYGPVAGQIFPRAQIQASLPQDAALIAWLDIPGQPKAADPNGEHWAILLRSTGSPVWLRLHGSGDKNTWTDADTQLSVKLRGALQTAGSDWQPLADRLRKQRLEPLTQHLKDVRRLIVLPSTALAGVPLEVIADKYTVSYAHSGTMYDHLLRQPAPTGKGLFVLADPIFDPPTEKEKPQPLPPGGVLLTMVSPGSNAALSGLKPNDVLLRYGDTDLNAPTDFKPYPASNDPKKLVPVIVWRDGHKLARRVFVPPGKLGVVIAKDPAPQAVAEQRRIDRWLVSRSGDDGKWPRLPGTRIEAASLHRLLDKDAPVRVLLDSDASEQRLNDLAQRGELGNYRYLHLATHGEVDNDFPLRSAVILSRDHLPDEQQRTELLLSGQPIPDGRLTAEEALQRWDLHRDLVTLSACQTALGKYERGEGFVGFAQALGLCGARSVCLSLWKVNDTATALLMERFYQNLLGKLEGLKAPLPKAAALAEAKVWLRTLPREEAVQRAAVLAVGVARGKGAPELPPLNVPLEEAKAKPEDCPFAHPYYWAAFVLVGHAD